MIVAVTTVVADVAATPGLPECASRRKDYVFAGRAEHRLRYKTRLR